MGFVLTISDIFSHPSDDFPFGINVLLGKIFKGSGFKLKDDALVYEEKLGIENHKSTVGDFTVTNCAGELFELLEMSYDTFAEGFDTKEEMYAFVATTPYLKSSEFSNPKKKYSHPAFEGFKDYLLSNSIVTPGKNMTHEHVNSIVEVDVFAEVDRLRAREIRKRSVIEKFSGRMILDKYPELTTKRLGKLMIEFKHSFGDVETYRDFILDNSVEGIFNEFEKINEL